MHCCFYASEKVIFLHNATHRNTLMLFKNRSKISNGIRTTRATNSSNCHGFHATTLYNYELTAIS